MNFLQAAFSSGAPIVTSPFKRERSYGVFSWIRVSISSDAGDPVRNVTPYFSTYCKVVRGEKLRITTRAAPTKKVGHVPPEWLPPR